MKLEPGMAYNTKKLNKIFAVISVIFLLCTLWMMIDDYIRPWKAYQIQALKVKREILRKQLNEDLKSIDQKELEATQAKLIEAQKLVVSREDKINEIQDELTHLVGLVQSEKLKNSGFNSMVSETNFKYDVAQAAKSPNTKSLKEKLDNYKKLFAESNEKIKFYAIQDAELKKQLTDLKKEQVELEKSLKKLTGEIDRKREVIEAAEFEKNPVWFLRNAPFIDFLDPTIKIQQVVLKNLSDDRYFQHPPKVDRCMTCHVNISQPGYEEVEQPLTTHPKLDMYMGDNSAHPMKKFGCTTCHGGEGHRVNDFNSAAHTPENEKQEEEWVQKYGWHEPHKIPQPMLKTSQTESSCVKCHTGVELIPGGTVINEGRKLIKENGCYGCHKIQGWEHLKKPGPSLLKIKGKISLDFFKSWVWNPYSFNPHSKMPAFFNQANNSRPDHAKKNLAEVNAIAEYIYAASEDYQPTVLFNSTGNKDKGKQLIQEIGCLGCHQVEGIDEQYTKSQNKAGSYLGGLGSKVNKDWLTSWLKNPSHYQEDTIMPSFRLNDQEVQDIASYLLQFENKTFARLKLDSPDPEDVDSILLDYLSAFDTKDNALKKLAEMSFEDKKNELGRRSINKYGCYSCHNIKGFDGLPPIGPELTNEGSKPLTQFDFAHEKIPHQRDAWIHAHLQNPARWDVGRDKAFRDLNKMPNFYLKEKDIKAITVALLGQVNERIPMEGKRILSPSEKLAEEGFKRVDHFNCMGCHSIDGVGGEILKNYDDINNGPPRLNGEGHRVHQDWFYSFLDNVYPIRPWINVRMPSFKLSSEDKNKITDYFKYKEKQPTFEDTVKEISWNPGEREEAYKLFNALACTSCHTTGFNKETPSAPNLYLVRRRLRPSWIKKWLRDPQKVLEGTVMPSFWIDGVPLEPGYFGGDAEKQIDAITKLILELGDQRLPQDIVAK